MQYNVNTLRFSQKVKHKTQYDLANYAPRYITKK